MDVLKLAFALLAMWGLIYLYFKIKIACGGKI